MDIHSIIRTNNYISVFCFSFNEVFLLTPFRCVFWTLFRRCFGYAVSKVETKVGCACQTGNSKWQECSQWSFYETFKRLIGFTFIYFDTYSSLFLFLSLILFRRYKLLLANALLCLGFLRMLFVIMSCVQKMSGRSIISFPCNKPIKKFAT